MSQELALACVIVPVTPFQQNCSIIKCLKTGDGAVVDPGGEIDRILGAAKTHDIRLTKILVTHGHMDHCGAAAELAERLSIPIEGPQEEDRFWIAKMTEDGARYGMTCHPFEPDRWLEQGDTVTVGALTLGVHHCPGHTPGHIVFHHAGMALAWVGDVLFQGSIGRTDFPRGHHQTLLDSIIRELWPLGDNTVFIPGHGPTSTFGAERQTNPYVADKVLAKAPRSS